MNVDRIILAIGFLAQIFFSARILVQWILSERAKRVLSPSVFWILSLAGSFLLGLYGWLRDDFSILLGQFIAYYIYLWNLKEKGVWQKMYKGMQGILAGVPVLALFGLLDDPSGFVRTFFQNEKIPLGWLLFGSAGQILFTLRFVYQWAYSYRRKESILPPGFWWMSLAGSSVILIYGGLRGDLVLIVGQSFGLVAYVRNLGIWYYQLKSIRNEN